MSWADCSPLISSLCTRNRRGNARIYTDLFPLALRLAPAPTCLQVCLCVCVCVSKTFSSETPAAQVAEHFLDAIPMWDITHSYTGHCEMTDICDTIGQLLLGKEPAAQGSEYILDDPWMCAVELLHQWLMTHSYVWYDTANIAGRRARSTNSRVRVTAAENMFYVFPIWMSSRMWDMTDSHVRRNRSTIAGRGACSTSCRVHTWCQPQGPRVAPQATDGSAEKKRVSALWDYLWGQRFARELPRRNMHQPGVSVSVSMWVCIFVSVCPSVCVFVCVFVCMCTWIFHHVSKDVCVYICIHICM